MQNADSAAQAVVLLEERGLTAIRLQSHILTASQPLDTHGLNERDYARHYHFFQQNQGWKAFFTAFTRQNWWLVLLALVMATWCLMRGDWLWAALVLVLLLVPLAWGAWKYRDALLFNQLLEAIAHGQWQRGLECINTLRRRMGDASALMELAVHEACIQARLGRPDDAQVILAEWKPLMDSFMPGMYSAHQARVALAQQRYDRVRDLHRQAMDASGGDAAMTLDYALMEARYGSAARAHCLLLEVATVELPEYGYAFVPWVEGIIALRQQRTVDAREKLQQAMSGMSGLAGNPALWMTLAMVSSDLGKALLGMGGEEQARGMVSAAWPVLSVHGDPDDLALFRDRFSLPA
ncbi:hypothetical protein [Alcanivorax sp.]|uniref:hypothetical protein n=1 Tax=Alcanivorax sp. TaxID=1872427 RepID=UPI003A92DDFE